MRGGQVPIGTSPPRNCNRGGYYRYLPSLQLQQGRYLQVPAMSALRPGEVSIATSPGRKYAAIGNYRYLPWLQLYHYRLLQVPTLATTVPL